MCSFRFGDYQLSMPDARDMNGSTCSVEMEDERMSDWGSPHFTNMENEGEASEQVQRDPDEDHGAHFNFAHFGVSFIKFCWNIF